MSDPYPIVEVRDEWLRAPEEMGSKTKFWYFHADQGERYGYWLFKYPQSNTGQHWAEKIAAEVALLLDIPHARVELATCSGQRGSVSKSFVFGDRELVHGSQVLEWFIRGYDSEKTFGQSNHTLKNIWKAMDLVFAKPEARRRAKVLISQYVILDAVIGNTDRHHDNWGIIRERDGNRWVGMVAPSFDHASSLGRELLDERRERFLQEGLIGNYAENGRGAIYWSDKGRHGPSPLALIREAAGNNPGLIRSADPNLARLDGETICNLVNRMPANWMTPSARKFTIAMMNYTVKRLKRLLR